MEAAVPCNDVVEVEDLGFTSMLSTAAVENKPNLKFIEAITTSYSYVSIAIFPIAVDICNNISFEIHIPR